MNLSQEAEACLKKAKAVGWDLSLDSIKALLEEINNPQDCVPAVHVTGTNGKGSVCAFLTNILVEAGYKVGRYTSPAVESEYERFTINNSWITEEDYIKCFEVLAKACEIVTARGFRHPSVFELETALAYLYFATSKCDIMIIEVGMGGLLDATNVMSAPKLCVFASIGLDHTQWLGKSIEEITKNKAGIIKPGAFVVSAPQENPSKMVLKDRAKALGCQIVFAKPLTDDNKLSLKGTYQLVNSAVAVECAYALRLSGFAISDWAISQGLKNTIWPFRYETISKEPLIILDGAHNPPAIARLKETIQKDFVNKNITFVVSVLADKAHNEMFKNIFPIAKSIVVVQSESERALNIEELFEETQKIAKSSNVLKALSFSEASSLALETKSDAIICFGTFTFLNQMKLCFKENLK